MKKFLVIFSVFVILTGINISRVNADQNVALLEYCTGTWCQWCPCGHSIVHDILTNYPNTVVLAYHGAGSDPWQTYTSGIRSLFGFSAYPTGVVGRKTGVISNSAWNNEVVLQTLLIQPGVSISVNSKNYDEASRTLTATVTFTALSDISGDFYVNNVLTESNLIYPQTGNGSCPGASNYVHDHVVKSMMNGDLGELLHSGSWTTGVQVITNINFVLPASPVVDNPVNCDLNIFVYKQGSNISLDYNVQQAMRTPVTGTTGIVSNNSAPAAYSLSQNYPNPFNPSTKFSFSIPRSENVTLKFYDILGNELETYINGVINAGTYSVEFDGSKYSSGIYFYKLTSGNFTETRKMNLIK